LEKVIHAFPLTEEMPYGSLGLDNIETAGGKRLSKKAKDRRVHLVPNPCTIQINEVTIGFTSLDAYMHISTESTTKLPVGNRLKTLAEQFIKQRSYYPIFPASSGNGRDFNLDVTKMEAFSMPVQPDILILPSLLACTATTVAKGTTFVNPGHLVKGSYGGTYAILDIHPIKSDILENSEDEKISHSVSDRIRVEVRKI
jgi:DNA polymerase alpha subunit B